MSSFGDWIGLIAILAVVKRLYDNEFAVAGVLLARLAPALLFGPLGGVMADRWSRKKVMVFCDIMRAALVATLPFVESIGRAVPLLSPVVVLFIVSAALEILTLLWQPAKDASVPDMVKPRQLTHAYSLLLIAAYATFPLSGATFGLLTKSAGVVGRALGLDALSLNKETLAFFLDAGTFLVSAGLTLTLRLKPRPASRRPMSFKGVWEDLAEGLRAIAGHSMIRPWVIGIGGTFAGIGVFMSMALFFVDDVLGGGSAGFGLLVTAVGIGLGAGFILAGSVSRLMQKDVFFSTVVLCLGGALIGFGSVSTLSTAVIWAGIAGVFAGFAYPSGYALVQERIEGAVRGRISAAVNSVMRLSVVGASALAPALVRLVDNLSDEHVLSFMGQSLDVRGVRVVVWLGGLTILMAGVATTSAIRARWEMRVSKPGVFLVFEGGEGSGKSTQMEKLRTFLQSQGRAVVVSREPGGTAIGERVRDILLDLGSKGLSDKAEALLYAADRAQHVEELIRPALAVGAIVISDRYLDSSVAYQGLARGLGFEEVRDLNRWGTSGLVPDLVFLLDFDAQAGLDRAGVPDRIEQEGLEFHEKVRNAYRYIADRYADRFVVIDAAADPEQIHSQIVQRVLPFLTESDEVDGRAGETGDLLTR